jgi:hypothetical protein
MKDLGKMQEHMRSDQQQPDYFWDCCVCVRENTSRVREYSLKILMCFKIRNTDLVQ